LLPGAVDLTLAFELTLQAAQRQTVIPTKLVLA
jgi:hypothetical protein